MLTNLTLLNFIIIKELNINFNKGMSVFTGETGAGKSILLNALELALGAKASTSYIRNGEDKAVITAVFSEFNNNVISLLENQDINIEDELILRRVITKEGSSKAFVNDTQVSISFLKQIGTELLEIHGQFDNQKLLNPIYHLQILNSYLSNNELIENVKLSYKNYKQSFNLLENEKKDIEKLENDREYLEYVVSELEEADIQPNEELELITKRKLFSDLDFIKNAMEKIVSTIKSEKGILNQLNIVINYSEKVYDSFSNNSNYIKAINLINNAFSNVEDAGEYFNDILYEFGNNDININEVEERISLINTLSKKHKVASSELYELTKTLKEKLNKLNLGQNNLIQLKQKVKDDYNIYLNYAKELQHKRLEISKTLENKVNSELAALKLNNASFKVSISNAEPSENGIDKIVFQIKTNIGGSYTDLNKIASGGEMARFMLALKVVLAEVDSINTIIFDEIDIGVGGDVAYKIGTRLFNLSKKLQVLVITHSHQVAATGNYHYKVVKNFTNNETFTSIYELNLSDRIEEVARMISADKITEEARITAQNLLNQVNNSS